jgi:flagellar protein FlaG
VAQPETRELAEERRNLIKAVKEVERSPELGLGSSQDLTFAFDRSSRQTVVKIVDRETREVVRQFPAEEILRMAERLRGR